MSVFLIWILLMILLGIYVVFKKDAEKKNVKLNWIAVIIVSIMFIVPIWFLISVYIAGTDPNPYQNLPSIYD